MVPYFTVKVVGSTHKLVVKPLGVATHAGSVPLSYEHF